MISMINEALLALSRSIELSILCKATFMLVIGLAVARLAKCARAAVRHLSLTATFATLLALPLIALTAPAVMIEVPVSQFSESLAASKAITPSDALRPSASSSLESRTTESDYWSGLSWRTIIRSVWIAGAILLFLPVAIELWQLRRIRRDGLPATKLRELTQSLAAESGIGRSVEVLLHEDIPAPLTCGVSYPTIMLPCDACDWSENDLRRALVHELEHVRRGDWAVQFMARATCALYWFHPLVWVALRQMCLEAERACDDAVVQGAESTDYADQLVLLAGRLSKAHKQSTLGMANRSDLAIRVSALLDGSQRRGRVGLRAAATAMIIASLITFSVAPVRAIAQFREQSATATQEPESHSKETRARRSSRLDRALFEATESGDITGVDGLLNAGANVNCALSGDGSPLIAAARSGRLATVQLLLDRGADPNMMVRGDGNPIIAAARKGHADVVALLLDRGASIDQIAPDDENALIQASGNGHLVVVKLLFARGADVNARAWAERTPERPSGEWRTPLSMARKRGHHAVVAFLLASGARE